ncbi:MAG: hypothetical protein Q9195_005462 [Heterodermia aff. obscurata]
MSVGGIFPIFCTVDVSSEFLTTFLLQAHEPMRDGYVDEFGMECVILRSPDLTTVKERTAIPTSGEFPEALITPFPNWTAQQVHDYLQLHGPGTKVHTRDFVIIDARSLQDYTCEIADRTIKFSDTKSMRHIGNELKTARATFRDSILQLVNFDISNMDIEEAQVSAQGGVSMTGETEESRKKDLEGDTWAETVLRSGKVVRD